MIDLTNQHREDHSLPPLRCLKIMNQAAQYQADYMCKAKALTHKNPLKKSLSDRLMNYDYVGEKIGENIAKQNGDDYQAVFSVWISNEPHRNNIEGNYEHLGIGSCKNGEDERYWVQVFGKKRDEKRDLKDKGPIVILKPKKDEKMLKKLCKNNHVMLANILSKGKKNNAGDNKKTRDDNANNDKEEIEEQEVSKTNLRGNDKTENSDSKSDEAQTQKERVSDDQTVGESVSNRLQKTHRNKNREDGDSKQDQFSGKKHSETRKPISVDSVQDFLQSKISMIDHENKVYNEGKQTQEADLNYTDRSRNSNKANEMDSRFKSININDSVKELLTSILLHNISQDKLHSDEIRAKENKGETKQTNTFEQELSKKTIDDATSTTDTIKITFSSIKPDYLSPDKYQPKQNQSSFDTFAIAKSVLSDILNPISSHANRNISIIETEISKPGDQSDKHEQQNSQTTISILEGKNKILESEYTSQTAINEKKISSAIGLILKKLVLDVMVTENEKQTSISSKQDIGNNNYDKPTPIPSKIEAKSIPTTEELHNNSDIESSTTIDENIVTSIEASDIFENLESGKFLSSTKDPQHISEDIHPAKNTTASFNEYLKYFLDKERDYTQNTDSYTPSITIRINESSQTEMSSTNKSSEHIPIQSILLYAMGSNNYRDDKKNPGELNKMDDILYKINKSHEISDTLQSSDPMKSLIVNFINSTVETKGTLIPSSQTAITERDIETTSIEIKTSATSPNVLDNQRGTFSNGIYELKELLRSLDEYNFSTHSTTKEEDTKNENKDFTEHTMTSDEVQIQSWENSTPKPTEPKREKSKKPEIRFREGIAPFIKISKNSNSKNGIDQREKEGNKNHHKYYDQQIFPTNEVHKHENNIEPYNSHRSRHLENDDDYFPLTRYSNTKHKNISIPQCDEYTNKENPAKYNEMLNTPNFFSGTIADLKKLLNNQQYKNRSIKIFVSDGNRLTLDDVEVGDSLQCGD